jgi:hypothetical protein
MCSVNFQPFIALSSCGFASRFPGIVRQALQFGFVGHHLGKGVGGVEQVLGELCRELGEFLGDGLEARLPVFGQLRSGEAEIADLMVDNSPPWFR